MSSGPTSISSTGTGLHCFSRCNSACQRSHQTIAPQDDPAHLPRGQLAAQPLVEPAVRPAKGVGNRVEIGVGQFLAADRPRARAGSNGRGSVRSPPSVASSTTRPPACSTKSKQLAVGLHQRPAEQRPAGSPSASPRGRWPAAVGSRLSVRCLARDRSRASRCASSRVARRLAAKLAPETGPAAGVRRDRAAAPRPSATWKARSAERPGKLPRCSSIAAAYRI